MDVAELREITFLPAQVGAALVALWSNQDLATEEHFLALLNSSPHSPRWTGDLLAFFQHHDPHERWMPIISNLLEHKEPGYVDLCKTFKNIRSSDENELLLRGAFLMLCYLNYYPSQGAYNLTRAMVESGRIIDIRPVTRKAGYTIVRRYPTGGLSEKVALILPSMIEALGELYKIKSTFLVARSLSFTGGTWDKLSSLPGFTFPANQEEVLRCLAGAHVCMTVTQSDIDPADEVLYQLRSQTCTVENELLIVSSIASKHLAVPADVLLLDIRIGPGTFIRDYATGMTIGTSIKKILDESHTKTLINIKNTDDLNGSAVGNYLELMEATSVLSGKQSELFDPRGLDEQWSICIDFFIKIVCSIKPDTDRNHIHSEITLARKTGDLIKAFAKVLKNHGVPPEVIQRLFEDPRHLIAHQLSRNILAEKTGSLTEIDQKRIGYLVNSHLGGGGNLLGGHRDLYAGIIIKNRKFDYVREGDVLCTIIGREDLIASCSQDMGQCFSIN